MSELILILEKTGFIILLMASGMVARHFRLIRESSEEDLGKLFTNLFWPCLILWSVGSRLEAADITANCLLPLTAVATIAIGLATGLVAVLAGQSRGDRRKIFLFHATFNNFSFMVLPFAMAFLPEKGAGLLFISNLGFILAIQSLGIIILKGHEGLLSTLRHLASPGLLATLAAILLVLSGFNHYVPSLGWDLLSTLGAPTIPVALLLAGSRIYGMGLSALRFDRWNIGLAALRLLVVPGLVLALCFGLRGLGVSRDILLITMLVAVMPVSVNSVSMAIAYRVSPDLAAQGVIFTHLFSIVTVTAWIMFIQKTLLA
jgi:predicted permease